MSMFVQGHGPGAFQLPASLGQLVSASSLSVVIASDYTLPVTITSAVNNPLWTELTDGTTAYVGAKTGQFPSALGQQVKASSLSVTLASDTGNLPVSIQNATLAVTQSGTWNIGGIPTSLGQKTMAGSTGVVIASDQSSLPVTVGNASIAVTGTFWQATQPVSAAALPLPTGASTSALQTTANTSLASIDTKLTSPLTISQQGRSSAWKVRNDYTSTNVTTGAYVQLVASTANACSSLRIFDSSGAALVIATGAGGSEVDQLYVPPGGFDSPVHLSIAAGIRVAIKSVDTATVNVGQLLITALQ